MGTPNTLPEACDSAYSLCAESTASGVGMAEMNIRVQDLKKFVDEVFHPMLDTELSGQVAGEMAGIMSDIGALIGQHMDLASRFSSVYSVLSEMRLS